MTSLIEIELVGFDEAERNLRGFAATMLDLRPFWPLVVPLFIAWMGQQFASEGDWGGDGWAPLTADYGAYKASKYPGKGILVAEGNLKRAATSPQRTATPSSLTLTIVDETIEWHQDGTDKMPARPVIPAELPFSAEAELEAAQNAYIAEMAGRFGL